MGLLSLKWNEIPSHTVHGSSALASFHKIAKTGQFFVFRVLSTARRTTDFTTASSRSIIELDDGKILTGKPYI